MFQFYTAGYAKATDPFEVTRVVHHAIHTDAPVLRCAMSWGWCPGFIAGRSKITDEQWVALGAIEDDDEYYQVFSDTFGLDISVKSSSNAAARVRSPDGVTPIEGTFGRPCV